MSMSELMMIQERKVFYNTLKGRATNIDVVWSRQKNASTNSHFIMREVESDIKFPIKIYLRMFGYKIGNKIHFPYMEQVSKQLRLSSCDKYRFDPPFTNDSNQTYEDNDQSEIRRSEIYDLGYDQFFVMKKHFVGNALFDIKIYENKESIQQCLEPIEILCENSDKKDEAIDDSYKTSTVPYFFQKGELDKDFQLYDIPFTVVLLDRGSQQNNEYVFQNISQLNEILYTKYSSFLRDYFYYRTPVYPKIKSDGTPDHDYFADTIYRRIDPSSEFFVTQKVSDRDGCWSDVDPEDGGNLRLTSVVKDQLEYRSNLGHYRDALIDESQIINVALHSSHFDNDMIQSERGVQLIYGTHPKLVRGDDFMKKNILYVSFLYTITKSNSSTTMEWDNHDCEIHVVLYTDFKSNQNTNSNTDQLSYSEASTLFSSITCMNPNYFEYLARRLIPFIFTSSHTSKYRFTLKSTESASKFKLSIFEKSKMLSLHRPTCILFYGDDHKSFFETQQKFPSYSNYLENILAIANFDKSAIMFGSRKDKSIFLIDFDYNNIIKESYEIFVIATQISKLCHLGLHEVFHGGKKLWHLRSIEFIMCSKGKAKPNRLAITENYQKKSLMPNFGLFPSNQKSHLTINNNKNLYGSKFSMEERFPEEYEKWHLSGGHIGNVIQGLHGQYQYDETKELHQTEDTCYFFDYDAHYFAIICECELGFTMHYGKKNENDNNSDFNMENKNDWLFINRDHLSVFTEWLTTRRLIKKNQGGKSLLYQALKLLNNSFYGCIGSKSSPIRSKEFSNYITFMGRLFLSIVYKEAASMNLKIGMAQTDSICVVAGIDSMERCDEFVNNINNYFSKNFTFISVEEKFKQMYIFNKTSYIGMRDYPTSEMIHTWFDKLKCYISPSDCAEDVERMNEHDNNRMVDVGHDELENPDGIIKYTRSGDVLNSFLDVNLFYRDVFKKAYPALFKIKGIMKRNWSYLEQIVYIVRNTIAFLKLPLKVDKGNDMVTDSFLTYLGDQMVNTIESTLHVLVKDEDKELKWFKDNERKCNLFLCVGFGDHNYTVPFSIKNNGQHHLVAIDADYRLHLKERTNTMETYSIPFYSKNKCINLISDKKSGDNNSNNSIPKDNTSLIIKTPIQMAQMLSFLKIHIQHNQISGPYDIKDNNGGNTHQNNKIDNIIYICVNMITPKGSEIKMTIYQNAVTQYSITHSTLKYFKTLSLVRNEPLIDEDKTKILSRIMELDGFVDSCSTGEYHTSLFDPIHLNESNERMNKMCQHNYTLIKNKFY